MGLKFQYSGKNRDIAVREQLQLQSRIIIFEDEYTNISKHFYRFSATKSPFDKNFKCKELSFYGKLY